MPDSRFTRRARTRMAQAPDRASYLAARRAAIRGLRARQALGCSLVTVAGVAGLLALHAVPSWIHTALGY